VREERKEASSTAEVRASLYCALALGFSAPDERTLEEISENISAIFQEAESFFAWPALQDRIKSLQASIRESDRTSLKAEHHRLFGGPYKLLAPPYASLYLESEPTVMGTSSLEALRIYKEAGFLLSPSYNDLPDHIATELEFMALLCEEEGRAWQKGDLFQGAKLLAREETFLADHLARWIPKFSATILSSTESRFYRALASLAQDYVLLDLDCVRAWHALLTVDRSMTSERQVTRNAD